MVRMLAVLLISSVPALAADQTLVTADGKRVAGRLKAVTLDGKVIFAAADGKEITAALDDVSALELNEPAAPAAAPAEVWLPGGGVLLGDVKAGGADALAYKGDLGEFKLPLQAVRALRFPRNLPDAGADDARRTFSDAFERARADASRNDDVLFARRGEAELVQLSGFLTAVGDDQITFRYQGNERTLARGKVYAVVLSGRAAKAAGAATAAKVVGVGGSTAGLEVREMRDSRWRLLGPLGLDVSVAGDRIAKVEFRNGRIVWLADSETKPGAVKYVPLLGDALPAAATKPVLAGAGFAGEPARLGGREVRGLTVRPLTEIRYDLAELGGDFRFFTALIGIDDGAAAAGGKAVFEVLADGKSVFKAGDVGPVPAGGKPQEISVPLEGVKTLVLRTDFGAGVPVGQLAVWGDARLLKK